MAVYVIGDVQGCYRELNLLLDKIAYNAKQDQLWFTGDLVNRGPHSLAVLRLLSSMSPAPVVVLGNHDLHLLAVAAGKAVPKKQDTFHDVLTARDGGELCDWLRQQPLLHHDSAKGFLMVHAGLPPQWDIATASACAKEAEADLRGSAYKDLLAHMYGKKPNYWRESLKGWGRLRFIINSLTRLRFCTLEGEINLSEKGVVGSQPKNLLPWFKVPNRRSLDTNIVFGHWAALNGCTDEPNVYAVDTGCAWGNYLTAMRLEDGARFNVPALKA